MSELRSTVPDSNFLRLINKCSSELASEKCYLVLNAVSDCLIEKLSSEEVGAHCLAFRGLLYCFAVAESVYCTVLAPIMSINTSDSKASLRPVKRVQFGILSPEEIVSDTYNLTA